MIKSTITALIALVLSGCMYQSVSNTEIEKAVEVCTGSDNIIVIDSYAEGGVIIRCKSGVSYAYENGKLR